MDLSPVPNDTGATEEYAFAWHIGLDTEWAQTYSVGGWYTPQDDVWVLARTFAEASGIGNVVLPIDLWRTGRGVKACLSVSVDWLSIVLTANKPQGWIIVRMFAQDREHEGLFRRLVLRCDVQDAVSFGVCLEKEIVACNETWAKERGFTTWDENQAEMG